MTASRQRRPVQRKTVHEFLSGLLSRLFSHRPAALPGNGRWLEQLRTLERRIGHTFRHRDLLVQALKHRSYLSVLNEDRIASYERLEFLGDAVLNMVVSEFLYSAFPRDEEGDLTKHKALLVNKKTLARKAEDLGIGEFVLLSDGEERSGGRTRTSILSDVLESIVGALLLDAGYHRTRTFIQQNLLLDFHGVLDDERNQNFKGELLEYTQSHDWGMPAYTLVDSTGPEHQKEFTVEVLIRNEVFGVGKGMTKKDAEQQAAKEALIRIRTPETA